MNESPSLGIGACCLEFVLPFWSSPSGGFFLLPEAGKGRQGGIFKALKYYGSYNSSTKRSMERNLKSHQRQLAQGNVSEAKKDQWWRAKESVERALQQLEGGNYFTYSMTPLSEGVKDHPEMKQMIEVYKTKFKEEEKPDPPASPLGKH